MTIGVGYWSLLGSLLSFASMGIVHKLGDRVKCNPLATAFITMTAAMVFTVFRAGLAFPGWMSAIPNSAALLAVPFGVSAALALWLFQKGLRFGHIVTSWLLINLSTGIPTVLSMVVYRESLSLRKSFTFALIVVSLLLLWWDRRGGDRPGGNVGRWFRLMMLAFLFNGLCTFGLRILTAMNLGRDFTLPYLVFWYLGGAVVLGIVALASRLRPRRPDILIGGGLGLFSSLGQGLLGAALASGLPGNIAYPVALAGGLFIVVALGVTVFRERIGFAGLTGVVIGIASIALLSLD
jgi:multidrug transporter EmrE-like cation transporter